MGVHQWTRNMYLQRMRSERASLENAPLGCANSSHSGHSKRSQPARKEYPLSSTLPRLDLYRLAVMRGLDANSHPTAKNPQWRAYAAHRNSCHKCNER